MQTHLVLLLDCFVEKTLGHWEGPGKDVRHSRRTVKKRTGGAQMIQKSTLAIMKEIGPLLTTFQADKDKVLLSRESECLLQLEKRILPLIFEECCYRWDLW